MLLIRTPGGQNPNLGPEVQFRNRKYFKNARNGREIYCNPKCALQKSRGQTGSSCVLWPTFGLNSVKLRNGAR